MKLGKKLNDIQNVYIGLGDVISADVPAIVRMSIPTDTRFGLQWHLNNTGQSGGTAGIDINVTDVWDDYTGEGVLVGVIDDGFDFTHTDLSPNYDTSKDRDAADNDSNASPVNSNTNDEWGDNHGTAVAGVIAAARNGSDVVGVAYDATLIGLRIGFGGSNGVDEPVELFNYAVTAGVDILNNSWGYGGFFSDTDDFNDPYFRDFARAIENAADNGRGGLGIITFTSSGNSGDHGQDVNYHNFGNSRFCYGHWCH